MHKKLINNNSLSEINEHGGPSIGGLRGIRAASKLKIKLAATASHAKIQTLSHFEPKYE